MTHKSVYFSFCCFWFPCSSVHPKTNDRFLYCLSKKKDSHYVKKALDEKSASTQGQGLNMECINGSRKLHVCDCNGQLMNQKLLLFQKVAMGKSNICLTFLNTFIPSNTKKHGLFSHFFSAKKMTQFIYHLANKPSVKWCCTS